MLHEARMNFQRTIVNQAPRFPCRGAAQFNPGLEVLRWGYGGGMDNIRRGRAPSVNLFDHQSGMVTHTSEKSCPEIRSWPLLPSGFRPVFIPLKTAKTHIGAPPHPLHTPFMHERLAVPTK